MNMDTIQRERELVVQNIDNLEKQIAQLTQQLQQAQQNLLASRGAVLAFDRLIEINQSKKEESAEIDG